MGNVEFPGVSELIYVRTYVNIHTYDRIYIERDGEISIFSHTISDKSGVTNHGTMAHVEATTEFRKC